MIVSQKVAQFLYRNFKLPKETTYVYIGSELAYSILTGSARNNPGVIPAPSVYEAIECLWEVGIQIYYIPESDCCRGYVKIGKEIRRLKILCASPEDVYEHCLELLADVKD